MTSRAEKKQRNREWLVSLFGPAVGTAEGRKLLAKWSVVSGDTIKCWWYGYHEPHDLWRARMVGTAQRYGVLPTVELSPAVPCTAKDNCQEMSAPGRKSCPRHLALGRRAVRKHVAKRKVQRDGR